MEEAFPNLFSVGDIIINTEFVYGHSFSFVGLNSLEERRWIGGNNWLEFIFVVFFGPLQKCTGNGKLGLFVLNLIYGRRSLFLVFSSTYHLSILTNSVRNKCYNMQYIQIT